MPAKHTSYTELKRPIGRTTLGKLLLAGASAGLLNFGLKLLFGRSRPELWTHLVTESSYSFPSGHAMLSSALALALVSIFWGTKYRVTVAIGAALYIAMIGFTRLYLGVHYPSDIIAGWCASFAWVIIVTSIAHTFFTNRQ